MDISDEKYIQIYEMSRIEINFVFPQRKTAKNLVGYNLNLQEKPDREAKTLIRKFNNY